MKSVKLTVTVPKKVLDEAFVHSKLDNFCMYKKEYIDWNYLIKKLLDAYSMGTYILIKNNTYKYSKSEMRKKETVTVYVPTECIRNASKKAVEEGIYHDISHVNINELVTKILELYSQGVFVITGGVE